MKKEEIFGKELPKLNLQFFAEGEEENTDVEETEDNADDAEETKEEKTLTQTEAEKILKERLARSDKKWQKKLESMQAGKPDNNNAQAEPENPKLKEAEEKAAMLEVKMLVYEAGVSKDSVDDVVALAKAYVNDDTDLEDAIEKVLEKYPQFKGTPKEVEKQSWGTRQKGSSQKSLESMTYEEYKAYRRGK